MRPGSSRQYAARWGKPLFREQIEAWQHGPVVPTEYFRFSQFGGSAIPPQVNFDDELIEPRDLAVSNDVYGYYGQYSAWKLRNMTPEEAPWIAAWNRDDKVISNEELRLFFEKEVGEEYTSSYAASSRERGNSRQSGLMCRPSWRASYQDASRFAN